MNNLQASFACSPWIPCFRWSSDLPVTCNEDQERYSICLAAEVDIRCAVDLKATLLDAVASRKEVRLELKRATELDVTAVQLLWAAVRALEQTGVALSLVGESREIMTRTAREMGLDFALAGSIDASANGDAAAIAEGAE